MKHDIFPDLKNQAEIDREVEIERIKQVIGDLAGAVSLFGTLAAAMFILYAVGG